MAKTHWKKLTNPDYLGAYALEDGKDMIVTIDKVEQRVITGPDGRREEAVVCCFKNDIKPMILNKTNMKNIEKALKTPFIEEWSGHNIQLYADMVSAFGTTTMALRVRDFEPEV